jgi:hypothetical protein
LPKAVVAAEFVLEPTVNEIFASSLDALLGLERHYLRLGRLTESAPGFEELACSCALALAPATAGADQLGVTWIEATHDSSCGLTKRLEAPRGRPTRKQHVRV